MFNWKVYFFHLRYETPIIIAGARTGDRHSGIAGTDRTNAREL